MREGDEELKKQETWRDNQVLIGYWGIFPRAMEIIDKILAERWYSRGLF